jgi:hypothetical protein
MIVRIFYAVVLIMLTSCNGKNIEYSYPKMSKDQQEEKIGNILTGDNQQGITLFGGDSKREDWGVGANSLLWQAALDSVNFMPIEVSDYDGGLIVTEWYSIDNNKSARYKFNININGKQLSATSLKVVAFKQTYQNGSWHSSDVSADFVKAFEMKILNRARELKVSRRS